MAQRYQGARVNTRLCRQPVNGAVQILRKAGQGLMAFMVAAAVVAGLDQQHGVPSVMQCFGGW